MALQDSVYFGTGMPDGAVVTTDEWEGFLATAVTPRFPQGLTVSTVSGQWRGADGSIVREQTHVLGLVHADDAASEDAIGDIIADYKTRFRQEAVLRVRSPVCISL